MKQLLTMCSIIAWSEFLRDRLDVQFKHWSFVINDRKQLVGWSRNRLQFPDNCRKLGFRWFRHTLHAEIAAYQKCCTKRGFDRRKPWSMINIRLRANGTFGESAPCALCAHFLKAMGCTQCWYTTSKQTFERVTLSTYLAQPRAYILKTRAATTINDEEHPA